MCESEREADRQTDRQTPYGVLAFKVKEKWTHETPSVTVIKCGT